MFVVEPLCGLSYYISARGSTLQNHWVPVKVLLFGCKGPRKSLMKRSDCAQEPILATVARLYSAEIRGMKPFHAFQCGSKNVTDTHASRVAVKVLLYAAPEWSAPWWTDRCDARDDPPQAFAV